MSGLVQELENWLRHIEDQLVKASKGEFKRFRPSLEGKDFNGDEREFDPHGAPILANNEGPNK